MIVSSPGQRCELLMALINYLENFFQGRDRVDMIVDLKEKPLGFIWDQLDIFTSVNNF